MKEETRVIVDKELSKAMYLTQKLYDKCMEKLLCNPDLTEADANGILNDIVEQAGGLKDLSFAKFDELFIGTLKAMGIECESLTKEANMSDEKKDNRVVVFGSKAWNETYKGIVALRERTKNMKFDFRPKKPTIKGTGRLIGRAAAFVARPSLSLIDGVRDGWKKG